MFLVLQVVTLFLVSVTMSLALAHALEFPGKMRLDKETYIAMQTVYYPGFTIGGIGEPLAVVATLVLLLLTPRSAAFWWTEVAFIAVLAMHGVFWLVTQPTNKRWMKNQELSGIGAKFFSVDPKTRSSKVENTNQDWKRLRDRWEYSHLVRAVLCGIALIALAIALAIRT